MVEDNSAWPALKLTYDGSDLIVNLFFVFVSKAIKF